ncbi:MAG: hypothetical protein QM780_10005 [Hyphomicrobium sp.]|uniref:hypothetical protein n=1 Tax=Hyphomicrobium sp. TaxID=82 RepID=UPI0039E2C71F
MTAKPPPPTTGASNSTTALTAAEIEELLAEAHKVDRILAQLAAAWLEQEPSIRGRPDIEEERDIDA